MSQNNVNPSDRQVSLGDLFCLLRRRRWLITFCAVLGGACAVLFALSRPVLYEAEATFLERGARSGGGGGLGGLIGMLSGELRATRDSAVPLMKSRRLWENLVYKYHLQGQIVELPGTSSFAQRARDHLRNELSWWRKDARPPLVHQQSPLAFDTLVYTGELPLSLAVRFDDGGTFHLFDKETDQEDAVGTLGTLVETPRYRLSLVQQGEEDLSGREFALSLDPVKRATSSYIERVDLKTDDKLGVLRLTLRHPDRKMVSQLLNSLMDEYRDYLEKEQETLSSAQLAYLEKRKSDSFESLHDMMQKYAFELSETLPQMGVIDAELELSSLEELKAANRERVALIDMELHRLQNQLSNGTFVFTSSQDKGSSTPDSIASSANSLSDLKQRRDRLLLHLSHNKQKPDEVAVQLERQVNALQRCRDSRLQVERLAALLRTQQPLPDPSTLALQDTPLVQAWYERVWRVPVAEARADLINYLDRHVRLANVQQRHIQEGLAHQNDPEPELEGIDLETATNIYVSYVEQKNQTQADIRQNNFVMDQVKDPVFELSALSGVLRDPVSQRVIDGYAQLSMRLADTAMRSPKEQERMKEEMQRDRAFLVFHLEQANQLLALREDFQSEKIRKVQAVMLGLIEQQISVTERHLQDHVTSHIDQLQQQRAFLSEVMQDINRQMSLLPQKWVADKMIKHQAKISSMIVEEVSKLVETKNISFHLEAIESAPLDTATPPLAPLKSNLTLFALMGLIGGSMLGLGWSIASGLMRGISVSEDTLHHAGQYVAGEIPVATRRRPKLALEKHLSVLRRLAAHLSSNLTLLLLGDGADYSEGLATLLSKEGRHVLLLKLDFAQEADAAVLPGLLQVLEGKASLPQIVHGEMFDSIYTGGKSPYGYELLQNARFHDLLKALGKNYDRIVVAAVMSADSSEAQRLSQQFGSVAVTLHDERWDDIVPFVRMAGEGTQVAFVLCQAR